MCGGSGGLALTFTRFVSGPLLCHAATICRKLTQVGIMVTTQFQDRIFDCPAESGANLAQVNPAPSV
jgi:hypothetical protein